WVVVQLNRDSVSRAFSQLANIGTQSDDDFVVRQNPDNTLTITGWRGSVSDVVIPDYLWGLRVTGIAANAFYRNREGGAPRLTSVAIPGTVTVIEVQAFAHNSLVQVTLAEGLERIEANAFLNNPRLSRIALPDSLTALGRSAFARCGITEIGFGRGLREIGAAAFADNNLTSLVIPSHVTNIEESAFAGNQIAELALPEGLVSIGGGAFADNNIRSVTLPASLRTLSPGVFNFNPIENLTILPPLPQMDNSVWQTFTTDVNQKLETLTRLSIPAGMSQGFMELNFPENLVNFWVGQGRAAGTYVRRGPIWARE
ncbi:MAG: leucine-rich repeat domain-containing protein, partial [Spirochaetes bacterium]|nr:leucine-rich repeat domain-containing protein [Spirochaetota bacterium]